MVHPKQLGEIIYNDLKIAKLKKTKKGSLATNAKNIGRPSTHRSQISQSSFRMETNFKIKKHITQMLYRITSSKKTRRVHTSFLLAATNTGRLASSDPNLQNIPIKT